MARKGHNILAGKLGILILAGKPHNILEDNILAGILVLILAVKPRNIPVLIVAGKLRNILEANILTGKPQHILVLN